MCLLVGYPAAFGAVKFIRSAIEPAELERCGTNQPLFFRPLPESVAKDIAEQCDEKMLRRYYDQRASTNSVAMVKRFLAGQIIFIIDPIDFAMIVAFSFIARLILGGIKRFVA